MSLSELLAGISGALSLAILPFLSAFIVFNVADKLGLKRIIARIGFFSVGVVFAFLISVWAVSAAPDFFTANAPKLDIVWALIVFYLGYIVIKSKNVFVIRAARDMFVYWCYGTFMIGAVFGSIWVNYLSFRDPAVGFIYEDAFFASNIWSTLTNAFYYSLGLAAVIALVGLITCALSNSAKSFLAKQRMNVKLVCGLVIVFFSIYIIFSDVFFILTLSRLPF